MEPNFHVGDFVIVHRAPGKGQKLNFRCMGPRHIIKVHSNLVYDVQKLNGCASKEVYCARLFPYRHGFENREMSQKILDYVDRLKAQYEIVDKIIDIGEDRDGIFLQIQWLELPDAIDLTRVSVQNMFKDMPDTVVDFLQNHSRKKALLQRTQQSLHLIA